ncbi:MAG: hypothetical protein AAB874_01475 [Patescibacteria group bacterium]
MLNELGLSTIKEKPHSSRSVLAVHFKLHGGDGVSLQSQLLRNSLRHNFYDIYECCADLPANFQGLKLPEISYQSAEAVDLRRSIFNPTNNVFEGELLTRLNLQHAVIRKSVERFIDENHIPAIHIHNILSLPYNVAATVAFYDIAKNRPDLQIIAHHHDLIFENRQHIFPTPKFPVIADRLNEALLPNLPNIKHVTINSIAAANLQTEKDIQATIVPDGFDFEMSGQEKSVNNRFRELAGIDRNDLIIGVMTRFVPRKAIEFAVQFVCALQQKRSKLENIPGGIGPQRRNFTAENAIILLLPQHEDRTDNSHYFDAIKNYAAQLGIKIVEAENLVESDIINNGHALDKISFYDVYPELDIVCYPTTQEGFGNQLLEAIALAGTVPVVFEYPVFRKDIAQYVPHIVSLGDTYFANDTISELKILPNSVIERAVNISIQYLLDPDLAYRYSQENFRLAKSKFDIKLVSEQFAKMIG